ncbi:MAG: methyltransferase domain-containing protein [Chloroflexota bacterium]
MNFYQEVYSRRWAARELERVNKVWQVLTRTYFQKIVGKDARVLDIGCGFCHFLNHLQAKEKVGVDANPSAGEYADKGVTFIHIDDLSLKMLSDGHFDCVFLSNFLEHLDSSQDVIAILKRVKELLVPGGKVIILQPNFRLLGPAYFDFIDHKTILTDRSVEEALNIAGFSLQRKIVRFLPYATRSKLPQNDFFVRLYLHLRPVWLVMGKQSLFVATK